MKVTCDREKLQAAFQTAAGVVPTRSPKPILQNIKLEVNDSGAILLATDLEIGIRIQVPRHSVPKCRAAPMLPIARFGSILRESSDEKLRIGSDGQVDHGPRRAERVQAAGRESARVSGGGRLQRDGRFTSCRRGCCAS